MTSETIMSSFIMCQTHSGIIERISPCRGHVQGKGRCKVQVKKLSLNWSLPDWSKSIATRISHRTAVYEATTIESEVTTGLFEMPF